MEDNTKPTKEEMRERAISIAQQNGDSTYYDPVTETVEATPAIGHREKYLKKIRGK